MSDMPIHMGKGWYCLALWACPHCGRTQPPWDECHEWFNYQRDLRRDAIGAEPEPHEIAGPSHAGRSKALIESRKRRAARKRPPPREILYAEPPRFGGGRLYAAEDKWGSPPRRFEGLGLLAREDD